MYSRKSTNSGIALVPLEARILTLRGQRVMVDADLAALYGVTTRRLNEQVKRNKDRFPSDFVFRLTAAEKREVVANCDHLKPLRFSATEPLALTEHGAIQAANVLNSEQAVAMGVHVVRAFVKLRALALTHKDLALKLAQLDKRLADASTKLGDHDAAIRNLVAAIRGLTAEPEPPRRRIGFGDWTDKPKRGNAKADSRK